LIAASAGAILVVRRESQGMKRTDDYRAKYELWARAGKVCPLPKVSGLPRFGSRRFCSYAEMNQWKQEFLAAIARQGGVRWTR
jgi:hypothetical protein